MPRSTCRRASRENARFVERAVAIERRHQRGPAARKWSSHALLLQSDTSVHRKPALPVVQPSGREERAPREGGAIARLMREQQRFGSRVEAEAYGYRVWSRRASMRSAAARYTRFGAGAAPIASAVPDGASRLAA